MTYLQSAEKGVVIGTDRRYTGLSHGGNENWQYTATGDLSELIPMGKLNIVMTVGKEQISVFDMNKAESLGDGTDRADARRTEKAAAEQKEEKEPAAEEKEPVEEKTEQDKPVEDKTAENEE